MTTYSSVQRSIGAGAGLMCLPMLLAPTVSQAQDFTAGIVVNEMEASERYPFVLGVVEGLSYARYTRDGNTDGMKCMYDWFLTEGSIGEVYDAFEKFADYAPGAVVQALLEKECGK